MSASYFLLLLLKSCLLLKNPASFPTLWHSESRLTAVLCKQAAPIAPPDVYTVRSLSFFSLLVWDLDSLNDSRQSVDEGCSCSFQGCSGAKKVSVDCWLFLLNLIDHIAGNYLVGFTFTRKEEVWSYSQVHKCWEGVKLRGGGEGRERKKK